MNTDKPTASPADEPPDDIAQRIDQVTGLFLSELRKGQSVSIESFVEQHPDLAPYLEPRLRLCRAIYLASRNSSVTEPEPADALTADFSRLSPETNANPFAFRIRCPHCGHQVQIIDEHAQEVVCMSCGSSVRVASRPRSSKPSAPPMPEKLGHFKVLRVLGGGGFGVVYLAQDTRLDRLVAIKVPRNGFFTSTDEEQRFFREAKNVARLKHTHIAQVYEISDNRFTPYIASEYIEGMTLRDHAKNRTLSFKEMAELMVQVAEAVDYAHRHKIIHRDLKASNILVSPNNHAYVVDFGLSRRDDVELSVTIDGALIGTLQYMAPEQASSQSHLVGPPSDVYSLGVILYELLCNELPFHGTKRMLIEQVIHDEPRTPRRLNEHVPADLETIALKAMAKAPSHRYESAQHMADDLRRWLRQEPILARPISSLSRTWSWCKRHPAIASLTAVIAGLLILVSVLTIGWIRDQMRITVIAVNAKLDSDKREYELLTQNGIHTLEKHDLAQSAFWLSEALAMRDTQTNRQRLGLIQDRLPKLNELWVTGTSVDILDFDETGDHLLTASLEGRVRVLDARKGRELFNQQLSKLSIAELSPNGEQILTCGSENHAQLWNTQSRLVRVLAHTNFVVSAHFNASGDSIATGGFDGFAKVWKADGAELIAEHKFEAAKVTRVEFLPNDTEAIVVTQPDDCLSERLYLWDFVKNEVRFDSQDLEARILKLQQFENGKILCCATRAGRIFRWTLPDGEAIEKPFDLPEAPADVFFESSERIIAVTDSLNAQSWDLKTRQPIGAPIRHASSLASADTDQAHNLLALGSIDGWLGVYWQHTGMAACGSLQHGENISQLKFHPNGRQLAIGGRDGALQLWDLAGAAPTALTLNHEHPVRDVLYSTNGQVCFTVDSGGNGQMWNTTSGQKQNAPVHHDGSISDCTLTSDGQLFITASLDKSIKRWNTSDLKQVGEPLLHEAPVTAVAVNSQGTQLISGCADGTVTLWPLNGVEPSQPTVLIKHNGSVVTVCFDSTGKLALSATQAGELKCWDVVAKQSKYGPFPASAPYGFCGFMPGDQTIFACDAKNACTLWDIQQNKLLQQLTCVGLVNQGLPYDAGKRLITCETGGAARLWYSQNKRFELETVIHHASIQSMRFASLNRTETQLAMSGGIRDLSKQQTQSGACFLWDRTENRPLGPPLLHHNFVRRTAFHPLGHQVATASYDQTARLWTIVTNDMLVDDAVRFARLIAQMNRDPFGVTRWMEPAEQRAELEDLRQKYPAWFVCDSDDLARWQTEIRLNSPQPKR